MVSVLLLVTRLRCHWIHAPMPSIVPFSDACSPCTWKGGADGPFSNARRLRYLNCSDLGKTMVLRKASISNAFCNANSWDENVPRISGSTSSWTRIWALRSKPHRPRRLATTAETVPAAKMIRLVSGNQKKRQATPTHANCQLRNQIPARMAPIRFINMGPSHVADSSNKAATPLKTPTAPEPTPMAIR
ncbi:hypothetical protein KC357_g137 [Hortaea werneckii]|nr:hypothetical protein KC357_g137 [Hortaea werneckii]